MMRAKITYARWYEADIAMNCSTCQYGTEIRGRKLPICLVGSAEYQLACIQDNYEHWCPKTGCQIVEKYEVADDS